MITHGGLQVSCVQVRWLEESEAERKSKEAEARRRDIEGTEGEEEPQLEDGVFKVVHAVELISCDAAEARAVCSIQHVFKLEINVMLLRGYGR